MDFITSKWKRYLKTIYYKGHNHVKDDSPIREYLGNNIFIEMPWEYMNMIDKNNAPTVFLDAIKKGNYDIDGYPMKSLGLYDYVTSWDKKDQIHGIEFVYTYPERLFNYPENQYEIIKSRLKKNLGSNRGVAVLYNPMLDSDAEDIPCLNWLQVTIRNNNLRLHCMFRSNDIYGAWPSNMLLLSYLGLKLASDLPDLVKFKGIDYHCSSAHYYKTDEDAVKKIIGVKE